MPAEAAMNGLTRRLKAISREVLRHFLTVVDP